jgi:hypothetical protein
MLSGALHRASACLCMYMLCLPQGYVSCGLQHRGCAQRFTLWLAHIKEHRRVCHDRTQLCHDSAMEAILNLCRAAFVGKLESQTSELMCAPLVSNASSQLHVQKQMRTLMRLGWSKYAGGALIWTHLQRAC